MNIFFISDTHFGHENMYKFVDYQGNKVRPFNNAQEADEIMIQKWNELVKPTDKIYHLGDVAFKCGHVNSILSRLNGIKVLVKGNHDKLQPQLYLKYFKDIRGTFHIDGNYLLSHFPIHSDSKSRFVRGLHGHIHTQFVKRPIYEQNLYVGEIQDLWYRNCCVEVNDYAPIPFEVIKHETEKLIEDGVINVPKKLYRV